MTRCPYALRWGTTPEATTQCDKEAHISDLVIVLSPLLAPGQFAVEFEGEGQHEGPGLAQFPDQRISWLAGDRREYQGDWPGYCPKLDGDPFHGGCTLPIYHPGRCAP